MNPGYKPAMGLALGLGLLVIGGVIVSLFWLAIWGLP